MTRRRQRTAAIRKFIAENVARHPQDIARVTAEHFGITIQAVGVHLRAMTETGALRAQGKTRARTYELRPIADIALSIPIEPGLEEDIPWSHDIAPKLRDVPENAFAVCNYGFTEMLNNVIDHSGSKGVEIGCLYTPESVSFKIADQGIGIFRKIKRDIGLSDERQAILELAKGKLTTDPVGHTGEGIFFTSRMVDLFRVWSGRLYFTHFQPDSDWLIETDADEYPGTFIEMVVSLSTSIRLTDFFEKYSASPEEVTFSKTHVPICLATYGREMLVSRSQAKRVLARFERFDEVLLDFDGVEFIGQAFADEIFRVYRNKHPETEIIAINTNRVVAGMIKRAIEQRQDRQLLLPFTETHDGVE